jgi:hypothetical protein
MTNKRIIIRNDTDALAYLGADPRREDGSVIVRDCGRCSGTGYWSRGHIVCNGVCFSCRGTGGLKLLTLVAYARRQRKAELRAIKAQAAREVRQAQAVVIEAQYQAKRTEQARELEERRAQERAQSQHLGSVGERLTVTAKIVCERVRDGQWGASTWFLLKTPEGQVVTWQASGAFVVEEGDTVTLKGTVKRHDEYQGTKQTVLTRCRFL